MISFFLVAVVHLLLPLRSELCNLGCRREVGAPRKSGLTKPFHTNTTSFFLLIWPGIHFRMLFTSLYNGRFTAHCPIHVNWYYLKTIKCWWTWTTPSPSTPPVFRPCPPQKSWVHPWNPAITVFQRVKHRRGRRGEHFVSACNMDNTQYIRLVHAIDCFRPVPSFVPIFYFFCQSNLIPLQFGNDTYPPVRISEILPQFGLVLFSWWRAARETARDRERWRETERDGERRRDGERQRMCVRVIFLLLKIFFFKLKRRVTKQFYLRQCSACLFFLVSSSLLWQCDFMVHIN